MLMVLFFVAVAGAVCPPNFMPNGTECTQCAPQYESNGTVACRKRQTYCPARRMDTALNCSGCPSGFYISRACNSSANSVCSPCSPCGPNQQETVPCGEFTDRQCDACANLIPPNSSFSGNCSWQCNPGFYRLNDSCVECEAGFECLNGTMTPCDPGRYSPVTRVSSCLRCPPNTWAPNASTQCSLCGIGSFISSVYCLECLPGTWSTTVGVTSCSMCAAGSWCNTTSAFKCPPNTTSASGAASYMDCYCEAGLFGTVTSTTDSACNVCSAGYFCNATKCI